MKPKIISLLMAVVLCNSSALAQEKAKQKKVEEVAPLTIKLNLLVADSKDQLVSNLTPNEIQIWEDEVRQVITSIEPLAQPLYLHVGLDNSGSMKNSINLSVAAAKTLVENLGPMDEVLVFTFTSGERIRRLVDRTSDRDKIRQAFNQFFIEGGKTAVIDALHFAIEDFSKSKPSRPFRPALVVFSDGEERDGYYSRQELMDLINTLNIPIFIIADRKSKELDLEKANKLLNRVALVSGGSVYLVKTEEEYEKAITSLFFELKSNYVVSYNSTAPKRDGKLRKIRVEVKGQDPQEKLLIRVRESYVPVEK